VLANACAVEALVVDALSAATATLCVPENVVIATAVADDSFRWSTAGLLSGAGAAAGAAAGVLLLVGVGQFHDQLQAHEQLQAWLYVQLVVVPSGRVQFQVHVH
jgi:hypothetical protein